MFTIEEIVRFSLIFMSLQLKSRKDLSLDSGKKIVINKISLVKDQITYL